MRGGMSVVDTRRKDLLTALHVGETGAFPHRSAPMLEIGCVVERRQRP